MADYEKVAKGLEWILEGDRFGFGKGITKPECDEEKAGCFIHDAIALLKEQDTEIRQLRLALDIAKGTCKGIVIDG